MTVGAVLNVIGGRVITIAENETVGAAAQLMKDERIGALVVSNDRRSIDGIISERDIAYGLVVNGSALVDTPVSEIMVRTVLTCSDDEPLADAMRTMIEKNIRHLPVTNGTTLQGIISIRDVLKFV